MNASEKRVSKPCCKGRWVMDPGFIWRLFIQRFEQTPFSGFLVHHIGSYWKEAGHQFLSYMVPEISEAKGEREEGGGQGMTWCYGFDIDGYSPWPPFQLPCYCWRPYHPPRTWIRHLSCRLKTGYQLVYPFSMSKGCLLCLTNVEPTVSSPFQRQVSSGSTQKPRNFLSCFFFNSCSLNLLSIEKVLINKCFLIIQVLGYREITVL